MSKKLIALILGIIFVFSVFGTACSKKTTDETGTGDNITVEETDRKARTLSLWLPTDASTTKEAVKRVERALNEITESKFSTRLELHAIADADYQDAIDAKIDSIADVELRIKRESESRKLKEIELAEQGIMMDEYSDFETEAPTESEEENEEETYIDEEGDVVSVYPEVAEDQLDIFLVRGYDNYKRYIDSDLVEMLDTELNGNSRLLRTYIYPSFLECVNQGGIYAIPNNHIIGEYQLLLVNKELADKYDYDETELEDFPDCLEFIKDIGSMNLDGVVPLLGEVEPGNMVYFSSDGNWSLLADRIEKDYKYKDEIELTNTLELPFCNDVIKAMKELNELGYVGDGIEREGQKFAVGVVKGDFTLIDKYKDDYYIHVHAYPYADEDDIFASMFAVSPYTKSVSRSMEIITYLNTNEEFRTILQYGVKGVHWDIDPNNSDVIKSLSSDYRMNIVDTGNIFMTYPDFGVPKSFWEGAKQQNIDSATSPYIGFEYITDANRSEFEKLAKLSAKTKAQVDAMQFANLSKEMGQLRRSLVTNDLLSNMLNAKDSNIDDSFAAMYQAYTKSK